MDLVCTLCRNTNSFKCFALHSFEACEEITQHNSSKYCHKVSHPRYSHFICSYFFVELCFEKPLHMNFTRFAIEDYEKMTLVKDLVICGTSKLKENVLDGCSVCKKSINGYFLIPCLEKYFSFKSQI